MRVVAGYPPNIEQIAAILPAARGADTLFCYGSTIYNPSGWDIGAPLLAHETVHSERQGASEDDVRAWWTRYLADAQFRFDEELPAHRAEYATFRKIENDRGRRYRCLKSIARRLASPLYGSLIAFDAAKSAISGGRC